MRFLSILRHRTYSNDKGFSLIEISICLAVMAILTVGLSASMIDMQRAKIKGESDANLNSTAQRLSQALQRKKSTMSTRTCADVLNFGTFNPTGQTDVSIAPEAGQVYQANTVVSGASNFTIDRLYLDDAVMASDLGVNRLYIANLFMTSQSSGFVLHSAPRQISTLTLVVNASTQALVSCNSEPALAGGQDLCDGLEGMIWNPATAKCDQKVEADPVTYRMACMPGFKDHGGGVCKPIPTTCASGQIAKGYNFSQVTNCELPPTPVVAPVLAPIPVVAEGAPAPTPAPVVMPAYVAPSASQTIAAPSAPAAPPATCTDGTSLGAITMSSCFGSMSIPGLGTFGEYCNPQIITPPSVAGSNCAAREPASYTTPNLAANPPAPSAPADLTCQCNSRRINNGEYCMYCVENVNLGFGDIDYAYGVSQCSSGNLVPVSSPSLNTPVGTCNNNYGRARYSGGGFQQYNELQ